MFTFKRCRDSNQKGISFNWGGTGSQKPTLNSLFAALQTALATQGVHYAKAPVYRDFRAGDVRHSQADIGKAQRWW